MAPRAELLKTEIDKAKVDLAAHLAELKVQAQAAQRKAMARTGLVLAIVGAGVVLVKLVRMLRRGREG